MKRLVLAAFIAFCGPALAEEPATLAIWREDSGSLPPAYAWDTKVMFFADRSITVRHCKGYADEAPGCYSVGAMLSPEEFALLELALDRQARVLAAIRPGEDTDPPIGGGSRSGTLFFNGKPIALPAFPSAKDAKAVNAALDILVAATPTEVLEEAIAKAIGPGD